MAAGLAALALWQAGSWKVGGLFIGGFAGGLVLLYLAARLAPRGRAAAAPRALAGVAPRASPTSIAPAGTAAAVLVTLGLAVMLVVAVALLEGGIRAALSGPSVARAPAFFFIDIQPDQAPAFARLVTEARGRGTHPRAGGPRAARRGGRRAHRARCRRAATRPGSSRGSTC